MISDEAVESPSLYGLKLQEPVLLRGEETNLGSLLIAVAE
jgi:hypothetical protein